MKKLLSLLLTALMICGLVLGASAEEPTVVKFWSHHNAAWNSSYEGLIAEFEAANPDVKVEYTIFPYEDFEAKMQTSLIAGDGGADVYEVWGGWMLDFIDAGALCETPEKFVADLRKDAFPPVLGTLQKDGKIYGAPVEFNVEYGGLLVNKKLFEENGIAYPATWADVMDIARQVAVKNGEVMEMRGLEYAHLDGLLNNFMAMILQKGAYYVDADGKLDFNTPEAAEAMTELVSYVKDDNVTNLDVSYAHSEDIDGFDYICMDECYMVTRGPWVIAECIETYGKELGVDIDYIAQPAFYPDSGIPQLWTAETGWSLCVSANTQVADAAWRFVEFLLEPENLVRHNINCAQLPPRASEISDPLYLEMMPYMKPLLDLLPNAQFIGAFNTDVLKEYLVQMYGSLVTDDGKYESVEDALAKLTEDMGKTLKIY
ncbi:MAG: extracellular solute-binding protein [Clostridia bacterium]|nr:extracellular solute-binding protein [Clostridia bacterium]